jgi:glycosyltransferase involved in cell wall biosynthesis
MKALLEEVPEVPLVSISHNQRRPIPGANWEGTVYHGLPRDLHAFREQPGNYLAFLGRISPEKRLDRAIAIAKAAGMRLRVAAKIYPEERAYYQQTIEPLLDESRSFVEFIGEVGGREKDELLGNAYAMLFPIDWPEPFGLVMIESLACGTPVIAFRNGSVPEVITDGVTGFVVDSVEEAVSRIPRVRDLSRQMCRKVFEERFDAARMARDYLDIYQRLVCHGAEQAATPHPRRGTFPAELGWGKPVRARAPLLTVIQ